MKKFSLDTHSKIKSGFTTPPDYFEQLPNQILDKIKEAPVKELKLFYLNRVIYAVAAILVLALSIPFFQQDTANSFEQIDTNSLENYITYQSTVSSYDIINLMDSQELDAMQVNIHLEDQSVEDILITNPNFENYIID